MSDTSPLAGKIKNSGKIYDSINVNAVTAFDFVYNSTTTVVHGNSVNLLYASGTVKAAKYAPGMINDGNHAPSIMCVIYNRWFGSSPKL